MRRTITILTALLPLLVSGCYVQSLHPFYIDGTLIEFPEIEGQWQPVDETTGDPEGAPWTFTKTTIVTFDDGVPSEIDVRYFQIDGQVFADWTAGDLDDKAPFNTYWATHVVPTHSVFRVRHGEETLALTPLDVDWLEKAMKAGDLSLSHVVVDDDRRVFTVSPEIWTRFLMRYGDDPEVFDPDKTYHFRWPSEPLDPEPPESDSVCGGEEAEVIAAAEH